MSEYICDPNNLNEFEKKVCEVMRRVSPYPPTEGELCDKCSHHAYDHFYPRLLSKLQNREPLHILEIGVYRGGSLKIWTEVFPNAKYYGVDWNYSNLQIDVANNKNVVLLTGNQSDPNMKKVFEKLNIKFDLIIDDGSHQIFDQMSSFNLLKDFISKDGYYVIEDIYPEHNYPEEFKNQFVDVDITHIKKRKDDRLFVYHNT
jgi:cephalosporin hydroxylase